MKKSGLIFVGVFFLLLTAASPLFARSAFDMARLGYQYQETAAQRLPQLAPVVTGEEPFSMPANSAALLAQVDTLLAQSDTTIAYGNPYYAFLRGQFAREMDGEEAAADWFTRASRMARREMGLHWNLATLYERNDQPDWLRYELDQLHEIKLDSGVKVEPILFNLAIYKGDQLREAGDVGTARIYYEFAKLMDPITPLPYLKLTSMLLTRDFPAAFSNLLESVIPFRDNFLLQLSLLYYILQFLTQGLYFGLLAAVLIISVKYLPKYQHYIFNRLPAQAALPIREAVAWVMVLSPLLLGIGVVGYAILGLVFTWYFYNKTERILGASFLVMLVVFPFLLAANYTAVSTVSSNSLISSLWRGQHWYYDHDVYRNLSAFLEKEEANDQRADIYFTLGLIHKRQGALLIGGLEEKDLTPAQRRLRAAEKQEGRKELDYAERYYERASQKYPLKVRNNLGNIDFTMQDYKGAVDLYESAARGDLPEAYFNLGQTYNRIIKIDDAKVAQNKAFALDPSLYDRMKLVSSHPNRAVVDNTIPLGEFWKMVQNRYKVDSQAIDPLWLGKLRGLNAIHLPIVAIASFILIQILAVWQRRFKNLSNCSVCSRVVSPATRRKFNDNMLCHRCYRAIAGTRLDAMRYALLARIRRVAEQRRFYLAVFLSIIFPGLGHLYRNDYKLGLPLTFLFSIHVLPFVLRDYLALIHTSLNLAIPIWLGLTYLIVVGLAVYGVSIVTILLHRPYQQTAQDLEREIKASEEDTIQVR